MTNIESKKVFTVRNLILIILTLQISSSTGQGKEKSVNDKIENKVNTLPLFSNQKTTFPQIHTNLNGMVREFVRTMYQDKKGNYWFGTNGDGIIRYNGQTLETMTIEGINPGMRVLAIVEDKAGNIWFGTSEGLIKYDGEKFRAFSKNEGLPGYDEEIWGLTIDKNGLMWVGSTGGVSHFDGEKFTPFLLPDLVVENRQQMLSDKLVFQFLEDKNGTIWLVTDGNGIFKYKNGEFIHLTSKNGLTDNNVADILEDKQGNIWIGTFYGGVSKYDARLNDKVGQSRLNSEVGQYFLNDKVGQTHLNSEVGQARLNSEVGQGETYTNFTKDGIIEGSETYNFCEDSKGNIWFTAEGYGVYRYDGSNFTQFTTEDGLTSNVTLSILEDNKGQLWFGSWQGLCIYDDSQPNGQKQKFVNANNKEPWTN